MISSRTMTPCSLHRPRSTRLSRTTCPTKIHHHPLRESGFALLLIGIRRRRKATRMVCEFEQRRGQPQFPRPLPHHESPLPLRGECGHSNGRIGERPATMRMPGPLCGTHQKTLLTDKGNDSRHFEADFRLADITPHLAQNIQTGSCSSINGRNACHQGNGSSINAMILMVHMIGRIKQTAGVWLIMARTR